MTASEQRDQIIERITWESGFFPELSIGDGWLDIVDELDKAISKVKPNYQVAQIKQKFGGLRYYTDSDEVSIIAELIRAAEVKAAVTCEECGSVGKATSIGYWACVLCDPCEKIFQDKAVARRKALEADVHEV